MNNNKNIKILNFISDLLNDDNGKIKLEATAIMGKDRNLACVKELITNKYFVGKPLNTFDNVILNMREMT